jgi:hypothetical protein
VLGPLGEVVIVGIDHLAFGSRSVRDDLAVFRELGYEAEFIETDLSDLDNKRSLMKRFSGRLDMALLRRADSLGVELLDHGHVVGEGSYLHPVFERVPHDVEPVNGSFAAFGERFVKVRSGKLGAEFFVPAGSSSLKFECRRVIVDTGDVERSVAFWQSIGFTLVSADASVIRLNFRSLLGGTTYELYVREERGHAMRRLLDAKGFNCIALVSSDSERDQRKFARLGVRMTESNRFHVGGRDLAIFWLQGPGGEIVEIIGLK